VSRHTEVLLGPPFPAEEARGAHVAVVDVLRATSTVATALANGAAGIIPVAELEDAAALASSLGRDRVLLCGERQEQRIDGFDLDNSPGSFTERKVGGKTIAFTTTNGTRALRRLGHAGAAAVYCAAFTNRRAIAAALGTVQAREALLVCAGTDGNFSLEDFLCAGALVDAYLAIDPRCTLSDAARASALTYRSCVQRFADAVAGGEHAIALAAKGFERDILAAAELDVSRIVPQYRDGEITTSIA